MNLKKLFLYVLIASVAFSAVVGIVVILLGNFGEFEEKVLMTALTVTVTSVFGLACGAYLETGRNRPLPLAGIAFAIATGIMWIVLIWSNFKVNDLLIKSTMCSTVLAASLSLASLLSLARLDRRFLWSRYAAFTAIGLLTGYILFFIWSPDYFSQDFTGRVLGVLSILVACLTVITPVFHKLSAVEISIKQIDEEIAVLKTRIVELEKRRKELDPTSDSAA